MTEVTKQQVSEPRKAALAAASGDPAVQHALAELQTAQMNFDAAENAVAKAKKVLADLGYAQ